jgi:endoglucanase
LLTLALKVVTVWKYFFKIYIIFKMKRLIFSGILLVLISMAAFPSNLVEVQPVDRNILVVRLDDGYVRNHGYHETGVNDTVFKNELDIKRATDLLNYTLVSDNDLNFAKGMHPSKIGRKSKPTEFTWGKIDGKFQTVSEHWIYLEFPYPLKEKVNYILKLNHLAEHTDEVEFIFNSFEMRSPSIHINQLGFVPESERKFAYISNWMGDMGGYENSDLEGRSFFIVRSADNNILFTGKVKKMKDFETGTPDVPVDQSIRGSVSGADIWECDFSKFNIPGEYKVVVEGMGCSYSFEIDPDIFRDAFYFSCRGLYHQRSGIELKPEFTKWIRPADHNPQITPEYFGAKTRHKVYLTSVRNSDLTDESGHNQKEYILSHITDTLENCWGFYHDAGDWDGYSSHIRVPRELMTAYEIAPKNFSDGELNIPESGNGIPDILDEAAWLINYFKRNKGKTGGIFGDRIHTEFCDSFPAIGMGIPSWEDPGFSIAFGEDPRLSYDFASLAMEYVWCLKKLTPDLPESVRENLRSYEEAAYSAYSWAEKNTLPQDSAKVIASRATADAWFYRTTGNTSYQDDFIRIISKRVSEVRRINEYNYIWALYAYSLIPEDFKGLNLEYRKKTRSIVVEYAKLRVTDAIDANRSFRSGGNSKASALQGSATIPYGMPALVAWKITGDKKYYQAAQTSADYALGGNPLNILWLTGLGDNPPEQIMNLDSYYDGIEEPIPGIAPYGPCPRCDWMIRPGDDSCKGPGPWDNDFALDQVYPRANYWPIHELWFDNPYSPPSSEYTVHQTVAPSAAVYGVLCQSGGIRKPNKEPVASLKTLISTDKSKIICEVSATDPDGRIDRVEFYIDHKLRYISKIAPFKAELSLIKGNRNYPEAKVFDNKGAKTVVTSLQIH